MAQSVFGRMWLSRCPKNGAIIGQLLLSRKVLLMSCDPHAIANVLLRAGAVMLRPAEPFTFASGLRSPVYCDNRILLGDVAARRAVTAAFVAHCEGAEVLAGPATGGIPWAAWAAE